ncbi:hypothetical protein O6H91_12G006000 [Diphasiastrum complanatum]|uniref:Uncharacterized protein n=1 Tax=Diphasiastrum complanatum TaxID=34168 RepID=A0ACC2BYN0_DIPCM|nr:hypothetical protein O6H91_12G006000 [Diphasiastrum complanatum]
MAARDVSGGRYVYGRHHSSEHMDYMVQIPPTPDNQPTFEVSAAGMGQQLLSSTMFTGGFKSLTRGQVMGQLQGELDLPRGFTCSVRGCDSKVIIRNERSEEFAPCPCAFRICRDCYMEANKNGGKCPGCKEAYDVDTDDGPAAAETLALPAPPVESPEFERGLSLAAPRNMALDAKMDRRVSLLVKNPASEFDNANWLFETRGTYGYGNAVWPKEDFFENERTASVRSPTRSAIPPLFNNKARRPLCRKVKVPAAILSPYRLIVVIRLVLLAFYLTWRVSHPNRDAMWLWGMSVICEIWFSFSWVLDQLPKLSPVNRVTDLAVLKERFESPSENNPHGRSDLPGIDVFVSTADPEKEPPLVTANTILSILATQYPVEKLSVYLSDDGGALLSFEALAEAASFAREWVPFCRKHEIEPRNPETYFVLKGDPTKNKKRPDFVKDRRRMKREYDEFKVRINGLPDAIRRRSDAFNTHEEIIAKRIQVEDGGDPNEPFNIPKATWMADGTHWPGTWSKSEKDHSRGDHSGIIQVMLEHPGSDPVMGSDDKENMIDTTDVDTRLPMLVYVSREKRPGYDHNKKAGAMNALVRTSAIMSNGAFILNLDCDHYIFYSLALREAMCFMMDRSGDRICYVQFPQRFEGIDPNDRYANHNTVFFDVNMRALDGIQGPVYVGTGCVFRRIALYGYDPPSFKHFSICGSSRKKKRVKPKIASETSRLNGLSNTEDDPETQMLPKKFGSSEIFAASIAKAAFQGLPPGDQNFPFGRPAGALTTPRQPIDGEIVSEAINAISCWYEEKTEWGQKVGWIYGSVTEDVVTGFRMHDRGWRSVYCVTKRDAFRGTAPINLTDRLHQVLRWATGSVEIFFSRNNAIFASSRLKFLQRIAYLNVGIYPFTSIFLLVYCFLPALSLFSGQFIVQTLNVTFLVYLLSITVTLCILAVLEVRWSKITLEEWWRNEQFWVIGGTSAHIAAVFQGLLKVVAGVDVSFTLTSKSGGDGEEDEYADLYVLKWTSLMIPPITIMMVNVTAIAVGISRTIYSEIPQWSKMLGGVFFSLWVLAHLYPFAKGLMGRRGRMPTIVLVWSGLLAIIISLLWVAISTPSTSFKGIGGPFQLF